MDYSQYRLEQPDYYSKQILERIKRRELTDEEEEMIEKDVRQVVEEKVERVCQKMRKGEPVSSILHDEYDHTPYDRTKIYRRVRQYYGTAACSVITQMFDQCLQQHGLTRYVLDSDVYTVDNNATVCRIHILPTFSASL